jgi:MinD-like ATPase involved in chromosome partitioning or flagellar assembly
VAIDLDLEAPGLGSLLAVETDRGVLDFVVDHLATGSVSLHGLHGPARALGAEAERVTVLPAGRLDVSFLEKLGRLDFAGSDPWKTAQRSPVEQALEALLEAVRRELKPDYILIDSRAGLHDLAGLSLHRLAHVDVLVGRASGQGYDGLDLTIEALAARKGAARMSTVILHTMTPEDLTSVPGEAEVKAFRERSWRAFDRHVYQPGNMAISEDTADAHHIPIAVPFDSALVRFQTVEGVERAFFGPGYAKLLARIEALCAPEDPA